MNTPGHLPPPDVRDAILAAARDAIIVVDAQGRVVSWNVGAETLFGYSAAEMLGQDLHQHLAPAAYHRYSSAAMERFASDGTGAAFGRTIEFLGLRKNGEEFPIEISLTAIETAQGRFAAAIVRDMSERRRLADALYANVQLLASLLDALPVSVMYCDRDSIVRGCNHAFEEFSGKSRSAIVGQSIDVVAPPSVATLCREKNAELFQKPGRLQFEAVFPGPDGRTRDVLLHKATWKGSNGEPAGVITVFFDLTEHKQVEALLRRQGRLAGLETLARGVAHELNNPLAVVRSCVEVLRDQVPTPDAATWFDHIDEAVARSIGIVEALQSQARAGSERVAAGVDLGDLVRNVVEGLADAAHDADVSIVVEISEGLPPVTCQRRAVGAVLTGLLENALEALVDGPVADGPDRSLRVVCSLLEHEGRAWVRTSVQNNGPAIAPAHLDRLFEPFFTTRSRATHRGLGLHVGRLLVRENGGELSVESPAGGPTSFHLDLPPSEA